MKEKIDKTILISEKERDKLLVENIESLPIEDYQKALLILVGLGLKPTTFEVYDKDEYAELGLDYEMKLKLLGFGVSVRQRTDLDGNVEFLVFVGKDQTLANKLKDAYYHPRNNHRNEYKVGLLLGFPETAAKAYDDSTGVGKEDLMIASEDLPREIQAADFFAFAQYSFSRANWKEELETAKIWADTIRRTNPALYERIITEYRKRKLS